MNERLKWMFRSFSFPRLVSTEVQISWWFALVPLVISWKYGLRLGMAYTGTLFVMMLLHEFAHVFMARWTGGTAEEIHLAPYAGLTACRPGHGAFGSIATAMAGPLVNFLFCFASFPGWYASKGLWSSLDPFNLPVRELRADHLGTDLLVLVFAVNWLIFTVNLLPAMPFDGGQIVRALLSMRIHPELVHRTTAQIGVVVALSLLIVGATVDISTMVLLGAFVLVINSIQLMHEDVGEAIDDSAYGYDFSTGYENLETTNQTATKPIRPNILQRWRERRRIRREQQERIRKLEAEQQLDSLLAKVHENGLQSLSDQEQTILRSCSELLRGRQKGDD